MANIKFGGAVMRNIGVKVNFMSEVQINYLIIVLEYVDYFKHVMHKIVKVS